MKLFNLMAAIPEYGIFASTNDPLARKKMEVTNICEHLKKEKIGSFFETSFFGQFNGVIKHGNIFASDLNPIDDIERARKARDAESARRTSNAIVQEQPTNLDSDGVMRSENDNSLGNPNVAKLLKNKFAIQWYENEKKWLEFEHKEMKKAYPQAELIMLKDDRLCWNITFSGILDADGNRHTWSFMLIYDSDHPHNRDYGGSIKVYPIRPSIDELVMMAQSAGRGNVPHIILDNFGNQALCTRPKEDVPVNDDKVLSAITVATWTASWATHFQMGLTNYRIWEKFCEH
jgi:hypothetical protein